MPKSLLKNLGFLLQANGLLTLVPAVAGFYFGESEALNGILLGGMLFLGVGFIFNALCERADLDYKSSCVFIVIAFIILPLIGAAPFFYLDPFGSTNFLERFTNAYFESISGYTTTGLSLISNPSLLPRSLLLYRSILELAGGVGVVFMFLSFFHTEYSLNNLCSVLDIEKIEDNLKKVFGFIFMIYGLYIIVFTVVFFFFGVTDIIVAICLAIDTLTGGFGPSKADFQTIINFPIKLSMILLMFLGSLNFSFNYHALKGDLKEINAEIKLYIAVILIGTFLVVFASQVNIFDSLFHVVSMASSTGFDYIGIMTLDNTSIGALLVIMLLGGCGSSMAGGIKMFRIIDFFKSIKQTVVGAIRESEFIADEPLENEENVVKTRSANVTIILFVACLYIFSLLFSSIGVSFFDALFEVGSALTTNGITTGATSVTMPIGYKYLQMIAMIIGRVEILTIVVALYKQKTEVLDITYRIRKWLQSIKEK